MKIFYDGCFNKNWQIKSKRCIAITLSLLVSAPASAHAKAHFCEPLMIALHLQPTITLNVIASQDRMTLNHSLLKIFVIVEIGE